MKIPPFIKSNKKCLKNTALATVIFQGDRIISSSLVKFLKILLILDILIPY